MGYVLSLSKRMRSSVQRMMAMQPQCLYPTHFGRVGGVERLAAQFLATLDRFEADGLALLARLPDDAPARLEHIAAIEACYSVAGEESYVLKTRVASPAELELLLAEIRAAANVSTRTSVVLSTPYENRPPAV